MSNPDKMYHIVFFSFMSFGAANLAVFSSCIPLFI
jgi:hypothetical protein